MKEHKCVDGNTYSFSKAICNACTFGGREAEAWSDASLTKNTADFDRQGFYKELGIRLRFHRKRADSTQQEMADAIGIPRATYANAESGRGRVSLDVVWRIAVVLGERLDRIVPEPQ